MLLRSSYIFFFLLAFNLAQAQKIKGLSLVAPSQKVGEAVYVDVVNQHANWVSLMPYSFSRKGETKVHFNLPEQWWGEQLKGVSKMIRDAHQKGIKVMLKPHLWLLSGSFTGHLNFDSEEDWKTWIENYKTYLLACAQLAQQENVELFCFSTEMESTWEHSPTLFEQLIAEIKTVYSGPITYAANWDEYKRFPFWNRLDYIGIDAYFPIDESQPKKSWGKWNKEIKNLSDSLKKQVIFTEIGYTSSANNLKEPWVHDRHKKAEVVAQLQAYEHFFKHTWNQRWLEGIFIWKWFCNDTSINLNHSGFSPQNKPAQFYLKTRFQENAGLHESGLKKN